MKFVIGTIPLLFLSKILERSIKLLFETRDISQVKQFVQRQCVKVLDGRASVQDLTFAKEYRGGASYRPGACVPALELTRCVVCFCAYGIQKKKARRRVDFSTISIYRQRRTPHGGMPIGSLSDPNPTCCSWVVEGARAGFFPSCRKKHERICICVREQEKKRVVVSCCCAQSSRRSLSALHLSLLPSNVACKGCARHT